MIRPLSELRPGDPVWREPVRVTLLETVVEVEPEAGIVTVVDGAGPATERRPTLEDPARYIEACKLLQDGAVLEYRGREER